jgi:hypothetical protein
MCQLAFCCDKIPKEKYEEEKFSLTHGFRDFCSWLVDFVILGPVVRQIIIVGACGGTKLAHLMVDHPNDLTSFH